MLHHLSHVKLDDQRNLFRNKAEGMKGTSPEGLHTCLASRDRSVCSCIVYPLKSRSGCRDLGGQPTATVAEGQAHLDLSLWPKSLQTKVQERKNKKGKKGRSILQHRQHVQTTAAQRAMPWCRSHSQWIVPCTVHQVLKRMRRERRGGAANVNDACSHGDAANLTCYVLAAEVAVVSVPFPSVGW